ncbi:C40 family peptidase [Clostridium sp. YIM B02551]|uniref:C40 family peptidase n=1 Tax=Clostridium sp. YIM B02551 TaxID=2910679 RepID=UPI001EEB1286|nr:C40 family peptidase [Clostridium sp. YIM B02551]
MKRKVISVLLTATLVLGTGVQALAVPLTDKQQQELNDKNATYSDISNKLDELTSKVYAIEAEIEPIQAEVDKNNKEIKNTQNQIDKNKKEIESTKKDLEEKEKVFGTRMREIYKSGGESSYIAVLLSSNSLGDFVAKAEAIGKLMSLDKKIIDDLSSKKKEYDDKIADLENKTEQLKKLNADNQVKLVELNSKKDEQMVVVKQVQAQANSAKSSLMASEKQLYQPFADIINNSGSSVDDLNNAISALRGIRNAKQVKTDASDKAIVDLIEKAKTLVKQKQAASNYTPSRGGGSTPTASSSAIVSYGYNFIGRPYVWGATGPDAFDCSGLVQYVYRHFGINLPRTTYDQVNVGSPVSYGDLQPGDIVFTNGIGHVGIYVGGGQMLHASMPGVGVIVGPIYHFVTARRI